MEAPGHMSPGHMSTRTSVSPGHMSTRTHVYPDKNARTPVARTHIPRTTGAASMTKTHHSIRIPLFASLIISKLVVY